MYSWLALNLMLKGTLNSQSSKAQCLELQACSMVFSAVLRIKLRALCLLGKHYTN